MFVTRNAGNKDGEIFSDILALNRHADAEFPDSFYRTDIKFSGFVGYGILIVTPVFALDAIFPQHLQHGKFKAEV